MADAAAVKIPAYNPMDPALWFAMCESTFELATPKAITDEKTKFNYCVAHLPPETASLVRDIILQPRSDTSYDELKKAISERCGESRTQEIRKLLAGEQLGDRKPSELLRDMKRRAENHNITDSLLLELFMQQMPPNAQSILASVQPLDAQKAASIADRIMEVTPPEVSDVSSSKSNVSSESTVQILYDEVQKLRKEVSQLRQRRSFSRDRKYTRHRSPSFSDVSKSNGYCWYHNKFKQDAKKCTPPCSYMENENGKV